MTLGVHATGREEPRTGQHGAASQPAWPHGHKDSKNNLQLGQEGVSTALSLSSQGASPSTFWLPPRGMVCRSQDREALRKSHGQNCRNHI